MDFCDKCGHEIDKLEPCLKLEYGFPNDDGSFTPLGFIYMHVDCITDIDALTKILANFDKN